MNDSVLLVIDIEATCWSDRITPGGEPQSVHNMEIIELGCALATRKGHLLDTMSFLARPAHHPVLSDFCISLTGITQTMVDQAVAFPDVVRIMDEWLGQPASGFVWASWGNYDRLHITAQSMSVDAQPTILSYPHLNLKRIWRRTTGQKKKNGLAHALAFHDLAFEGQHHRGGDDARNIVRLLPFMDWALESDLLTPR